MRFFFFETNGLGDMQEPLILYLQQIHPPPPKQWIFFPTFLSFHPCCLLVPLTPMQVTLWLSSNLTKIEALLYYCKTWAFNDCFLVIFFSNCILHSRLYRSTTVTLNRGAREVTQPRADRGSPACCQLYLSPPSDAGQLPSNSVNIASRNSVVAPAGAEL